MDNPEYIVNTTKPTMNRVLIVHNIAIVYLPAMNVDATLIFEVTETLPPDFSLHKILPIVTDATGARQSHQVQGPADDEVGQNLEFDKRTIPKT